ncbi:MAG: DUF3997 domain-containing protein [Bacteroidales bacterium]|nr:DUF3997 domain-containing protein [Bacteroidales bacterium]
MDKINIMRTIKTCIFFFFIILILQSCNYNNDKNLGDGFVYYSDHEMISNSTGTYGEIPSTILEYKHNEKFIIATQKPIENDPNALLYDTEYDYKEGCDAVYYWIILKETKTTIGPMTKVEFIEAREKHNISENLTLN